MKQIAKYLAVVVCGATSALAQPAGLAGVEGHVFNASKGTPLSNVVVQIQQTQTGTEAVEVVTDQNGFYAAPVVPNSLAVANNVVAICSTKRGSSSTVESLYVPLNAGAIYHRDLYLAPPKNTSKCVYPTPQ